MSSRILPALALLPLLAACTVPVEPTPDPDPAPEQVAVAVPVTVPRPIAPAVPVVAAPIGAAPPVATGVLGAPPPAAVAVSEETAVEEPLPSAPAGRLGTTVASLGSPTEGGGLWLVTPLVSAPTSGRIEYQGQSVSVQLRPSGGEPGSGSRISVEALRALGLSPTTLPELSVYAG